MTTTVEKTGAGFGFGKEELSELFEGGKLEELRGRYGGVEGLARGLRTSLVDGISLEESDTDYEDRKEAFTTNELPPAPFKSIFQLFWESFEDSTIIILCTSAVVSLCLGVSLHHGEEGEPGWIEGLAILIAVLIVASVTAGNQFAKEKQFRKLNDVKNNKPVVVIRGGVEREISIYDVLVGDLIKLNTGDAVPADGVFVSGHSLKTDESSMTGESDEIKKDDAHPWMLSGCSVAAGTGRMLVTGVGVWSTWGLTMSKLSEEQEDTPLQQKLEKMAYMIGVAGIVTAVLTFVVLLIIWIVRIAQQSTPFDVGQLNDVVGFFILAVTIVVVAVPEGLPLAVTISLAYSMRKMMDDHNLVRQLAACETMGGATNICSDKTGTLTENRMSVVRAYACGRSFTQAPSKADLGTEFCDLVSELVSCCSTAGVQERQVEDVTGKAVAKVKHSEAGDIMTIPREKLKVVGSKTEGALILLIRDWGYNYQNERRAKPNKYEWPFNADRKRMSVARELPSGRLRIYCKGASEVVLKDCDAMLDGNARVAPLPDRTRQEILDTIDEMATSGLRTLVLAYQEFDRGMEFDETSTPPDNRLTFVCLVGIMDPVRPEVPEAVDRCFAAGITVRMVTGDNRKTAENIARACGILGKDPSHFVMEGPEFRKLPRAQLDAALRGGLRVLARSSPTDKHLLVSRLRELGEVVAVTGDGTNDAPALKVADVGLSMGIAGTDVAKEASAIVILNDNFSSIVAAVKWGRGVFDNIRKFLQFQLTINVVALLVAFISALSQRGTPLNAVQLLWVNLIMDTLAALALGTEIPTYEILNRKPYGKFVPLISGLMWRSIIGQAIFQLGLLFGILYLGPYIWDVEDGSRHHYTLLFNTFVFAQVFNEFNARKVNNEFNVFSGLHTSWIFLIVIIVTIGFQILIVTFAGVLVKTVPLPVGEWFACIGIGAFSLVIGAIIRLIPVPRVPDSKPDDDDDKDKKKQSSSGDGEDGEELQELEGAKAD